MGSWSGTWTLLLIAGAVWFVLHQLQLLGHAMADDIVRSQEAIRFELQATQEKLQTIIDHQVTAERDRRPVY